MAIDYVVHYPCQPKAALGDGDQLEGTTAILDLLKARSRAETLKELIERDGGDLDTAAVTLARINTDGDLVETEVTYKELAASAGRLHPHEAACSGCPANSLGEPFGCFGCVNYPIPRETEVWLVKRLQPLDTVGGVLLMQMIQDFEYDGKPIKKFRKAGLLDSPKSAKRRFAVNAAEEVIVTSNQILQAIAAVGEVVDPGHALSVLLWLGGIEVNGTVPRTPEDAQTLLDLDTPEKRRRSTKLDLGPASTRPGVAAMQQLLAALYVSWVLDVPLLISA